jgi:hypothetical protein
LHLPGLCLAFALAFLIFARLFWNVHAFGLLSVPLFFVLTGLALAAVFYWISLGWLLLRGFADPASPPPAAQPPLL